MFDAKFVRENALEIRDTIKRQKRKELLPILDEFLDLDEAWRALKKDADRLRGERNRVSEDINKAKKARADATDLIAQAKAIPGEIKGVEEEMAKKAFAIKSSLQKMPNIMHEDVPYGASEEENVEVRKEGKIPTFSFPIKNHVELCELNGWADFEASAKACGNGFYYLKGDLALLNQALIHFAISKLVKKGYTYLEPPLMVRKHVLDAAMDSDGFEQSIYKIAEESDDPLCMIGTAEHPILGIHEGEALEEGSLPRKYAGYSMCFRQEIGSHGINEKGLWRTHQFNKVEQFIFCLPEDSWKMYDELMANSDEILKELELPYRLLEICTGDLALWKARSHDFEVWRPTTESYGEVMSLSNCTNYQAMDLGTRFVRKNGERGVVHTLNNTALATSRIMVAILENNQNEDGTVNIPKVLQAAMGKKILGK